MQTIQYLGQLAILCGIYLLSDAIVLLTGLPIPASVLGIVILFILLCLGIIKEAYVEGMADFLLRHLVFFFIPIVVGLVEWGGVVKEYGLTFVLAIVVSSLVSLFACAWTTLALYRKA